MRKIAQYLNVVALVMFVSGFALIRSFGTGHVPGLVLVILAVMALVAYLVMNWRRFKGKSSRMNFIFVSNILFLVILNIAIVAAVNYLGTRIHQRFDFSRGHIYSLSDQSVKLIRGLKKELQIKAFFTRENPSAYVFDSLMEIYGYYSDRIKVEVLDTDKNPSAVKTYQINSDGTVVFEYAGRETRIEEISEEAVTNAIIKVTREKKKVVYFLQGHGEGDTEQSDENGFSVAKDGLEKLSFRVKKLVLFQESRLPDDTAVLVVAGPRQPLFNTEISLIEDYIENKKGPVLFMINPGQGEELKPLLKKMGVRIEDDVIVDTVSSAMGGDYFIPVVARYAPHEITKNFSYATFYPLARSLSQVSPLPGDIAVEFVASTSPNSWGERNYEAEIKTEKIVKNAQDRSGPLEVIAAVEVGEKKRTRVVICGDSDFVSNKYYYFSANGNLFNNIISWLAQEGDLVAISPRTSSPSTISLTRSDSQLLFFYCLVLLPLLVLLAGIGIWWYRRKL